MGTFVPNTKAQQEEMLRDIGLKSADELFADVPDQVRLKDGLDLPAGMSEMEVLRSMAEIAAKNRVFRSVFRGAGAYRH